MSTLAGAALSRFIPKSMRASSPWPLESVTMGGNTYPLGMPQTSMSFKQEEIGFGYTNLAYQAMMANPVVFAIMERRRQVFCQARFQWRQVRGGTPGKLFGTDVLSLLEHPWPKATTGDLLARILQHSDLGGNAFIVRKPARLRVLRPDWVAIIAASEQEPEQGINAIDAEVVGYAYWPGGKGYGEPELLLPEEVAHFAPTPDPIASFRGMSWLTPAIRDIMGDQAAMTHKLKYFENGATGATVVKMDPGVVNTLDKFDAWVEKMEQGHKGAMNAYRTWYVSSAVDVQTVGANLRQEDFKVTVGAGETRLAAAGAVPPIIVGISEGLDAATYSNYGQARRAFSDVTVWDLWRNVTGSLEAIMPPPPNSQLWVDTVDVPFLQEDEKDRAEIQQMDASAINSLVTAGYTPESVVDAVTSGDLTRLVHSGLYSVQLQPAGSSAGADEADEQGRALIAQAEQRLLAEGVKPTVAAIAEALEVSDRTVYRWRGR